MGRAIPNKIDARHIIYTDKHFVQGRNMGFFNILTCISVQRCKKANRKLTLQILPKESEIHVSMYAEKPTD